MSNSKQDTGESTAKGECNPPRDLQEHFEAILGRAIVAEEIGGLALREQVANYTEPNGKITSRQIGTTGNSTKACGTASLLDVAGSSRTGRDGAAEFLLSEFFCGTISFEFPVNLVATPRSLTPVFMTTTASPTSDRRDVRMRARTWNADGSPAADISFDWRCRVPYLPVVD